jgi:protein O-GlcNAc transferase
MRRHPPTLLWLIKFPPEAIQRLRHAAAQSGVSPQRLVASDMAAEGDFLEMAMSADIFLDTPTCHAHTTASYAIWASTPVVTLALRRLVSRVGASLAMASSGPSPRPAHATPADGAGATGIARDLADYELLASALVTRLAAPGGPQRFAARRQVASGRARTHDCGLFDAACWAEHLDMGLGLLYEAACHDEAGSGGMGGTRKGMHVIVARDARAAGRERPA